MIELCEVALAYKMTLFREYDDRGFEYWTQQEHLSEVVIGLAHSPEGSLHWESRPLNATGLTGEIMSQCATEEEQYVRNLIREAAHFYGVDHGRALRVAVCESGLNPRAANTRSSARGVYQFLDGTWAWISTLGAPYPYGDRFNPAHNVWNAMWLMSREDLGGSGHWVCK